MSAKSSHLEVRYPIVVLNEFADWVQERSIFLVNPKEGMTRIKNKLPPLSKLILITSDNGDDSLFFSSESAE